MSRPSYTRPALLLFPWVFNQALHLRRGVVLFLVSNDSLIRLVGRFRIAILLDYQIL